EGLRERRSQVGRFDASTGSTTTPLALHSLNRTLGSARVSRLGTQKVRREGLISRACPTGNDRPDDIAESDTQRLWSQFGRSGGPITASTSHLSGYQCRGTSRYQMLHPSRSVLRRRNRSRRCTTQPNPSFP